MASKQDSIPARFALDDDPSVSRWFGRILVVCPECGGRAVNISVENDFWSRRLLCEHCGYARDWQTRSFSICGTPIDPFTDVQLWLVIETSKGTLFAYNEENLEALRAFVGAAHRERSRGDSGWANTGYFSRLPKWIKSRSNREMILQKIDQLKSRAKAAGESVP